jgi:hypothetical protein
MGDMNLSSEELNSESLDQKIHLLSGIWKPPLRPVTFRPCGVRSCLASRAVGVQLYTKYLLCRTI